VISAIAAIALNRNPTAVLITAIFDVQALAARQLLHTQSRLLRMPPSPLRPGFLQLNHENLPRRFFAAHESSRPPETHQFFVTQVAESRPQFVQVTSFVAGEAVLC